MPLVVPHHQLRVPDISGVATSFLNAKAQREALDMEREKLDAYLQGKEAEREAQSAMSEIAAVKLGGIQQDLPFPGPQSIPRQAEMQQGPPPEVFDDAEKFGRAIFERRDMIPARELDGLIDEYEEMKGGAEFEWNRQKLGSFIFDQLALLNKDPDISPISQEGAQALQMEHEALNTADTLEDLDQIRVRVGQALQAENEKREELRTKHSTLTQYNKDFEEWMPLAKGQMDADAFEAGVRAFARATNQYASGEITAGQLEDRFQRITNPTYRKKADEADALSANQKANLMQAASVQARKDFDFKYRNINGNLNDEWKKLLKERGGRMTKEKMISAMTQDNFNFWTQAQMPPPQVAPSQNGRGSGVREISALEFHYGGAVRRKKGESNRDWAKRMAEAEVPLENARALLEGK